MLHVLQCYRIGLRTRMKAFLPEPHRIWDKTTRRFQILFILPNYWNISGKTTDGFFPELCHVNKIKV